MEVTEDLEREITLRIIQEDAETIYSMLQSEHDGVFLLGSIPYYALFVNSCQEYLHAEFLPSEASLKINDIRNHIKEYARSFGKTKKAIAKADDLQDNSFKSQLRFSFMESWNIHFNLGIYFTDDGHIVGNSQQLANILGIEDLSSQNARENQFKLGYQIGTFVSYVCEESAKRFIRPTIVRKDINMEISYYLDLNTNKKNRLFVNNTSKELNLFYLNLLCNLNYVKYILRPLLSDENVWILRVEYVVTYYTYLALLRFKNHCENNDIDIDLSSLKILLDEVNWLFNSKFRSCMMHYGLEGRKVISLKYFESPLYGVIESCFGIDFYSYLKLLRTFSDSIISFLEDNFDCSNVKLKRLWKLYCEYEEN